MKKMYVAPEMEEIDVEMSSILSSSDDWGKEDGGNSDLAAPGMMSFDDIDTDYMEEDNI